MKSLAWIVLLMGVTSLQAQINLVGKVLDNNRAPLQGVWVQSSDGRQVSTNVQGLFFLDQLEVNALLDIDFMGYGQKKVVVGSEFTKDTLIVSLDFSSRKLDEVACLALRLDPEATNQSKLNNAKLDSRNFGQDIPYILDNLTSVVTTSDAGAGMGYSSIRVRGIDASRLNVTVNGIPINDPESHDVYWVNMPDITSSIQSLELQRGVSASSNGAAAFGASLNIKTNDISEKPMAKLDGSFGSFNSYKTSIQAHTGLIQGKYFVETRLSRLGSQGYIDRATSDLSSWYLSAGWIGKNTTLKGIAFAGKEVTYQSWYGTPESVVFGSEADRLAYADRNGLSQAERANLLNSGRTYNNYTYANQVDNYQQDNYQMHLNHRFKNQKWVLHAAGHYTYGRGYYEEFKSEDDLSTYQINPLVVGLDTISQSDLIRRRWLSNHFIGTVYALNYKTQRFALNFGGAANHYNGAHYGEVIWARYASNSNLGDRYYDEVGRKWEWSNYLKTQFVLANGFKLITDLQYRYVNYEFMGLDFVSGELKDVTQNVDFHFLNPKMALFYAPSERHQFYSSVARTNREPVRRDFRESTPSSRPQHETMIDFELGYQYQKRNLSVKANVYHMDFTNQLTLTGQINDVGGYTRTNVKDSYRQGLELEAQLRPLKNLELQANVTLSRNVASNYIDYLDVYLDSLPYYTQQVTEYSKTTLAFSPSVISALGFNYSIPKWGLRFEWSTKFVGKQYMDNIETSLLPSFNYSTLGFRASLNPKAKTQVELSGVINNVFNQMYSNNGYAFAYQYAGVKTTERFFYPQAGRNFMLRLSIVM